MDTVSVELHRFAGRRMVTGHYGGYPIVRVVTMEVKLVLEAATCAQLETMVDIAAVDGWSKQ